MSHEEQFGKNFIWGAFSQMFTRIFGLFFFVFMSYMLLERGMGQYNFIISFVSFWFIVSDFGVGSYLYREWSRGDLAIRYIEDDFNLVFTMKLVMSGLVFIPFIVTNWFVNRDVFLSLILYYIFVVLSAIISQIEMYLNSVNNFKWGAIRLLIERTVVMGLGGVMLLLYRDVSVVFIAMILSQLLCLYYYFLGRFPFTPKIIFNWKRSKELFSKGLPFLLFSIFLTIYGRIDMTMLKFMKGFEVVGWYSAGYKAYDLANIFSGILFIPAVFPILSRIYNSESRQVFNAFFDRCIRVLFSGSLFITMFFVVFAPHIVIWFFPPSFLPSILVMRIISLVFVISSLSVLFSTLLVIQNKEKQNLKIVFLSCLLNVFLNIILIPRYSLYGAAWATTIAELFNLFLLQHYSDWNIDKKMVLKMFISVLVTAAFLFAIRFFGYTNNLYIGILDIIFTMILIWQFGLVKQTDLEMLYLPIKNKFSSMFFSNENA